MAAVWLVAMVALLLLEAVVPGLVSIWFALGAFAALLSAMLNAPLWLQLFWFVLVSVAALWFTRPLVKKFVNGRVQATNADVVIGKDALVIEEIDNIRGTGAVSVAGKEWTARSEDADVKISSGEIVNVLRIEGVKLIVEVK
ncbi:MAG: NfeD family protein [Oscillospiraceae bacterium]|nr:NfeD family protein [Oscillospiraceae bacterium]